MDEELDWKDFDIEGTGAMSSDAVSMVGVCRSTTGPFTAMAHSIYQQVPSAVRTPPPCDFFAGEINFDSFTQILKALEIGGSLDEEQRGQLMQPIVQASV